jgi:hypothetical protein
LAFFYSLGEQGAVTKTGENSFSFSGTMYLDANSLEDGSFPALEISGTGTFNP